MRLDQNRMFALLLSLSCFACEKCEPERVGAGVARLTVRNLGVIGRLVNDDTNCGFSSPAVKTNYEIEGAPGMMGSVTWTVENCAIDLTEVGWQRPNCTGVVKTATGKIEVTATRTVEGLITGDAERPVAPMSPYAVTIDLQEAKLDNFLVTATSNAARLTQKRGVLRAKLHPRLAPAASNGICSIPTPHALVTDLEYENALVRVEADGRDFEVDVPASSLRAVDGTIREETNVLDGEITVWEDRVVLPVDEDGLDPDFDAAEYEAGYACAPDLKLPVTTDCGSIENIADLVPQLAQGASRLTIRNFATIARLADQDSRCGFSSPAAAATAQVNGRVGSNGDVTVRAESCTIDIPAGTVVNTTCTGERTTASGRVTITGTKKLRGRLSGDPAQPVIPIDDTPATVEITQAAFENFVVEQGNTSLLMKSGSISGQLIPRVAMDTAIGACAFQTPIARISNVSYAPGSIVAITAPQGMFETAVDGSNLNAVNGTWAPDSNLLRGTISLRGETLSLPTNPADDGLDPAFNQAAFDSSWMCGTVERNAPFECNVVAPLAQGTAQLTVLSVGTLANLVDRDTTCGFSSPAVLANTAFTGTLGDAGGTATMSITQPCELRFAARTAASQDCNGKSTFVEGTVLVRGTKTINGILSGDPTQPIIPTSRDPAVITLDATMTGFKIWTEPGDGTLEIATGRLSGTVRPRTALDLATGACSIATPVAAIEGVTLQDATVNLVTRGKTFEMRVGANLAAVNGSRDGVTNMISGSIDVDGTSVSIPIAAGLGLDPGYSQAAFDASYACIPNLRVPADDSECSMKQVIGEGVARLLISAMGTVTGISNADDDCGYAANLTDPSRVTGDPGDQGSMEWEIENCDLERRGNDANRPFATDCLGRSSYFSGVATVTGMRHIDGLRDEIGFLFIQFDTIIPDTHMAVTVNQRDIDFNEVSVYELDPGQMAAARKITIHSGSMSAVVNPVLGKNEEQDDTFDIPTKIARFTNVSVTNAPVTIVYQGKTFNAQVDSANLTAFNGSYAGTGEKNSIGGTITIGGQTVQIAPGPLDPGFNQADFDARYVCTDNLEYLVPSAP